MDKLQKIYEAIDIFESYGLPISLRQAEEVSKLEKDYVCNDILPLIEQELQSMVGQFRNAFSIVISFNRETGLNIRLKEAEMKTLDIFDSHKLKGKRQKKYILRVTFPDGHVSCNKIVGDTLLDVVKHAGPQKVQQLGLRNMGQNLVSEQLHDNIRYRAGQKEIEPGLYVDTYSSTDTKYNMIKEINKRLGLGLIIEKQLI